MVIYIEDSQSFNDFLLEFNSRPSRIYIQLSDTDKHALNNRISFIVVSCLPKLYVININHTDGLGLREDALKQLEESQRFKAVVNGKSVTHLLNLKQAVDIDLYRNQAVEVGIRSVPTVVLYKDGEEVDRQSGYQPKERISAWMNQFK